MASYTGPGIYIAPLPPQSTLHTPQGEVHNISLCKAAARKTYEPSHQNQSVESNFSAISKVALEVGLEHTTLRSADRHAIHKTNPTGHHL